MNPEPPELRQALSLARQGNIAEAISCAQVRCTALPDDPDGWFVLAGLYAQHGELAEVVRCCERVVSIDPRHAPALYNLGVAFQSLGHTQQAVVTYQRVISLQPNNAMAIANLALALRDLGDSALADAHIKRALALHPGAAQAHNTLGLILMDSKRYMEAADCFLQALALRSEYPEAHYNLGLAFLKQHRPDAAEPCFVKALALKPDYADAHCDLAVARQALGHIDEAIAGYTRTIELSPGHIDAHWNRSLAWLLSGKFAQGWPEYEWRWKRRQSSARTLAPPLWDGSSLEGKTILLHAEQGFGDTLQFIRYAPLVKQLGANIVVECQPELVRLLECCTEIDRVVARGETLPGFDLHAPLLSLPGIFRTTIAMIPAGVPYLNVPKNANAPMLLKRSTGRQRIGIVWAGNPEHTNDANRSCPLTHFLRLAELPDTELYSLQKGARVGDLDTPEARSIHDLGTSFHDFSDTAATLAQLDLVITIDTAIAHLTGALGKPVWMLLPFLPDWRWLLGRDDSPWYPTMRLFRQKQRGNWEDVFDRVISALTTHTLT